MRVRWSRAGGRGARGAAVPVARPDPPALVRAALIRVAVLVEDVVRVGQIALLRVFRRSTTPLLIPFVGHGSPQRVELGARAVLGRPEARARRLPATDGGVLAPARGPVQEPTRRSRRSVLRTSLARFLTVEVADAAVTARTPGAVVTVRSDRDGYVDAVVTDPGLSPGWHDVELDLADGATVRTPVLVVSPDVQLGLVSDVDDTIVETGLTRGLEFLRITLLTEVTDRAPLPGAAALYRALVCRSGEAGLPVFYLSTSPWNLHEMLLEFIALRGFPLGPLLLTDWGPGRGNLFRIGAREHKLGLIRPHPRRAPGAGAAAGRRHRAARPRDLRGRGARASRPDPGHLRAAHRRAQRPPRGRGGRARRRDHRRRRADAGRRRQCRDRRARRLAGTPGHRAGRRGAPRDSLWTAVSRERSPGRWTSCARVIGGPAREASGQGRTEPTSFGLTSAFSALPGDHRPW